MDGGGPQLTRIEAAQSAGRSERQMKTANRVASIPADQFTGLVESDNPPTVTKLAEMGTQGVRGAVRTARNWGRTAKPAERLPYCCRTNEKGHPKDGLTHCFHW
jgi:hypothetical protein|tara:strand:- start:11531 stop:11842 length:312 start_codon:yes stop_codon:yes gene_type:complete